MADDPLRAQALQLADDFDRRAAEVRREAEQKAQQYEAQAAQLRSAVGVRDEGLLLPRQQASMLAENMQLHAAADASKNVRISAARSRKGGESKRTQIAAGKTDQQIADFLGVGRSTVAAWHTGRNAIPKTHEARLRKRFGIAGWTKVEK